MEYQYRVLEHIAEFTEAVQLEIAVWGLDPRDAVPVNMLRAVQHSGGSVIGAYEGDRMIGIALAFPARRDQGWILWSHMTGVHRDYQAQGIGFELKQRQREWALANGYDEIRWTFDPLQRGNANFNLHLLGVTACQYHVNFYGIMADEINKAGIPSDRIEAIWRLRETRTETQNGADRSILFLLKDTGSPEIIVLDETISEYLVQIPNALPRDPEMLSAWRFALRQALMNAFQQGYHAVDFTNANAYLLRHL